MKSEKEVYAELLERPEWKFYRDTVENLLGGKCQRCGSTHALQVHHKRYIQGLKPWQYKDPDDIALLCVWCHKIAHGIMPEHYHVGTFTHPWAMFVNHLEYQEYKAKKADK